MRFMLMTALLLVLLAGCAAREKLPTIEQTLPPGFVEKSMPGDLYDSLATGFGKDLEWVRCIDCDLDWQELNRHTATALSGLGYSDSTEQWHPIMVKTSGLEEEHVRGAFKMYSSAGGGGHIFVFSLDYFRSLSGADLGTTGDYLFMAGWDRFSNYD